MLRFILLAILLLLIARTFWKVVDAVMEAAGGAPRRGGRGRGSQAAAVRLVRDPVCGTHVAPTTPWLLTRGGTTHYFCSEKCRDAYRPGT